MKKMIFGFTTMAIVFCLSGCNRPDTDVTSSSRYNFESFAGTVWKTKVEMALADVKLYTGKHVTCLLPPDAYDPTEPNYRPPTDMGQVTAILPVGTRVRIERLIKDNGEWGGVRVTAKLEDATYSQETVFLEEMLLAKNQFLDGPSDPSEWSVNPDMLEKAE